MTSGEPVTTTIKNDHVYRTTTGHKFLVVAMTHAPGIPTVALLPRGDRGFELGTRPIHMNTKVFEGSIDADLGPSDPKDLV